MAEGARKAAVAVFRRHGPVLCEDETPVKKQMKGRSSVRQQFAENQAQQRELNKLLDEANRAVQDRFRELCDEVTVLAKNGNGNGSCANGEG